MEIHLAGKPLITGAGPLLVIGSLPCEFSCTYKHNKQGGAVGTVAPTMCKKWKAIVSHYIHVATFQLAAWIWPLG